MKKVKITKYRVYKQQHWGGGGGDVAQMPSYNWVFVIQADNGGYYSYRSSTPALPSPGSFTWKYSATPLRDAKNLLEEDEELDEQDIEQTEMDEGAASITPEMEQAIDENAISEESVSDEGASSDEGGSDSGGSSGESGGDSGGGDSGGGDGGGGDGGGGE